MTTDLSLRIHSSGLDVLCDIIIGYDTQTDDGGSNLPYRRMSDIKNFFTDINIAIVEDGSRAKTTRATLSSINSTPQLKLCIESALVPAHFVAMNNPYEAFDALRPHLEAVGWTIEATKTSVQVLEDNNDRTEITNTNSSYDLNDKIYPTNIESLLDTVINGLPRAMFPLSQRRKGLHTLDFSNEYDVQDLLHSLLKPWVSDIRTEEFTPSYAGSSTRMDFLLPAQTTVIETKIVRNKQHAKKIGEELILDIAHYRTHPKCMHLWCVIYDPHLLLPNTAGLINDLTGPNEDQNGRINVIVRVI